MALRASRLGLMALILVGIGVAGPNLAGAQSAADKATARKLATDGIQLFRQDRIPDALDKLERAESLFDAPIHLLYIARCHAKLNHLVEATEAYRRLVRTELSAQAPQTFKDAVTDGQKELGEIEAKVPQLRVEVAPANLKDLRLVIDGEQISTAVLGVDRPINPGSHVIEVTARGQVPASRRIDVAIASKQAVKLELVASPAGNAVDATPVAAGVAPVPPEAGQPNGSNATPLGSAVVPDNAPAAAPANAEVRSVRIIFGFDLAGMTPLSGKIDNQAGTGDADQRDLSQRFGVGGGIELRAGVSIPVGAFALTPLLFVSGYSHQPGPLYSVSADRSYGLDPSSDSVMTTKPLSSSLGLGLRFDTAPRSAFQLGGFGEFGLILREQYVTSGTWTKTSSAQSAGGTCDFSEEFVGLGGRLRAGVLMPMSRVVTLVGAVGLSMIRVDEAGLTKKTCSGAATWAVDEAGRPPVDKSAVPADKRAWHTNLGLGLGIEFAIGL